MFLYLLTSPSQTDMYDHRGYRLTVAYGSTHTSCVMGKSALRSLLLSLTPTGKAADYNFMVGVIPKERLAYRALPAKPFSDMTRIKILRYVFP